MASEFFVRLGAPEDAETIAGFNVDMAKVGDMQEAMRKDTASFLPHNRNMPSVDPSIPQFQCLLVKKRPRFLPLHRKLRTWSSTMQQQVLGLQPCSQTAHWGATS